MPSILLERLGRPLCTHFLTISTSPSQIDAAKSLLMLPKEYFGTFDLVVVDLSETVMAFSVTEKLDIMSALSLLLQPNGVFVKNEYYINYLSDIFDYTVETVMPGVPVTCTQSFAYGSNSIDFLKAHALQHDLNSETLYVHHLEDPFNYFHDYRKNHDETDRPCIESGKEAEEAEVPTNQTSSPGILMLLEVENCDLDLTNMESVKLYITEALKGEGLSVTSSVDQIDSSKSIMVLIAGYIVLRLWPEQKYAAIDLHFWSAFDKQTSTRNAIVTAFGAGSSSYRIVAGGIFGVSTWKEDEMKRGPKVTEKCPSVQVSPPRNEMDDDSVFGTVVEESLSALLGEQQNAAVAVLCGPETCPSLIAAEKATGVSSVVPIKPCAGIQDANEFMEGIAQKMSVCESAIHKELLSRNEKIRAVLVDPSASLLLGQIAYRIFSTDRHTLLTDDVTAIASVFEVDEDEWRRNFLERFRKDIVFYHPNFRTEIYVNGTDSYFEFGITSSGDKSFINKLKGALDGVESKTEYVTDVREIEGGKIPFDEDWKAHHYYYQKDYALQDRLQQYMTQQPLGYQTLLQTEFKKSKKSDTAPTPSAILKAAVDAFQKVSSSSIGGSAGMANAHIEMSEIGEGCVGVAPWEDGTCVILWDRRSHLDMNLFTTMESKEMADELGDLMMSKLKLQKILLDVQPRGTDRVVNFAADLGEQRTEPLGLERKKGRSEVRRCRPLSVYKYRVKICYCSKDKPFQLLSQNEGKLLYTKSVGSLVLFCAARQPRLLRRRESPKKVGFLLDRCLANGSVRRRYVQSNRVGEGKGTGRPTRLESVGNLFCHVHWLVRANRTTTAQKRNERYRYLSETESMIRFAAPLNSPSIG